ncbi:MULTISPECIES: cadherin-like beta sandwich domain-containing protein [Saccharibacillus]|uniref:cadherin-like beta sandwich domain-containing protein n=1 Tax=Saccharibacillus TaxID=456492 RepID=UPI0012398C45|nr:cadherin-like beta sandwich domain-containing protein [Saccharibacillus sp. WB 17]MWJ31199.1 hypothetical protein [Saccharibacillus sp. WB 17]
MNRKNQRSLFYRLMNVALAFLLLFTSSIWMAGKASAASSWTAVTSNTTVPIYKIHYGNGLWVASAENGKVLTSPDGSSWTERTVDAGYTSSFLNVTYGGGQWVLVGNTGTVYTSSDAVNWTNRSISTPDNLSAIAYGNSTYVIAANLGSVYVSADAITWSKVPAGSADLLAIAYGSGSFVAAGSDGNAYRSSDGISWANRGPAAGGSPIYSVKFLNGSFYATSDGKISVSANGSSWNSYTLSDANGEPIYDVTYSGGKYVAAGGGTLSNGLIYVSTNGTFWTTEGGNTNQTLYGAAANGSLFAVVGESGTIRTQTISVSSDSSLKTLAISPGTLSPAFASGTTGYTANVVYGTTSVNITPTVNQANATVKINGTNATSGSGRNVPLAVGDNPIPVAVTAQDGSTTTYTVTVKRAAPNTNANLANLVLSQGTLSPSFDPATTRYDVGVANSVTSLTVTPTLAGSSASVIVNGAATTNGSPSGAIALAVGSNEIRVVVTAQDGTTAKTYTVYVTRAAPPSSNAFLADLALSQGSLSPLFASGTTGYSASVPNSVASLNVTPTVSNANASVTVNGVAVTSGNASGSIALNVGTNEIKTVVTAQDGTTTQTYTVNVTRAQVPSANADLSALALSSGTLSPAFASDKTGYIASVSNATTSLTVTPTLADARASVTVNDSAVSSGNASGAIGLLVGPNRITVKVTAENGTSQSYTVTVTRAANGNTNLRALSLSSGTLSPSFNSATMEYTVAATAEAATLTVTATTADTTASVEVNGIGALSGSASNPIQTTPGANEIFVDVTAQNGTSKRYTITVTRPASSNNDLSALSLSSGTLSPAFAAGTRVYDADVSNATTSLTVTPTAADANASVAVNEVFVAQGKASDAIPLNTGFNVIIVKVTAENGTSREYTVRVARATSGDNDLSDLSLSSGTLSPAFAAGTTNYAATVSNATTSLTVTPTTADSTASVKVNNAPVTSGNASGAIPLTVGRNDIETVVTAQNGTTRTYTITVTRSEISDADSVSDAYAKLEVGYAPGDGPAAVTQDLTLPLTGNNGTTVNWTSSFPGFIQADGTVTRPSYPNTDTSVVLNALIQKNAQLSIKTFTVVVKAIPITDLQAVQTDRDSLQVGYAPGDDASSVTQNVTLPTSGPNGTTLSWTSDTPLSIDASGTVTRSSFDGGDRTVKLTATIVLGSESAIRTFDVTVKAIPASSAAELRSLAVDGQTITPAFDRAVRDYSLAVPYDTSRVTVTASVYDAGASLTVQGLPTANGTSSAPVELAVGTNVIAVKVTAQDGMTQEVYTIRTNRAAAPNPGGGQNGGSADPVNDGGIPSPSVPTPADPPAPSPNGFEIRINGRIVEQIATGTLKQGNGQTAFNAVIDTARLSSLLASEGPDPLILVPVTAQADIVTTQLSGEALRLLQARGATLRIESPLGSYTLPAAELSLAQLDGSAGGSADPAQVEVRITIERSAAGTIAALNARAAAEGFVVVAPPVTFKVDAAYAGQTTEWKTFPNYVQRELPIPAGSDPGRITTAVVIEADGSLRHVPTSITRNNEVYAAEINSLTNSDYALIWSPRTFVDAAGLWSQSAVADMASRQILNGIDKDRFNPAGSVTRAEFAAVLVRALGLADNGSTSGFTDVSSGDWYAGAVGKAAEYGLIDGYADGTFRPLSTISRQEAFAILARAMQIAKPVSSAGGTSLEAYSDADRVGRWALESVRNVLSAGLVQGSGGKLNPAATMSRAETAALAQRLLRQADLID